MTTLAAPSSLVGQILSEDGFQLNPAKHRFGRLDEGTPITSLREVRGHLDVQREYVEELIRQIEDAASMARGGEFRGPYYTLEQIRGRVHFVCWVNAGRRRDLLRRFRSVNWEEVRTKANALVRTFLPSSDN